MASRKKKLVEEGSCEGLRGFVDSIVVDGNYSSIIKQLGYFTLSVCLQIGEISRTLNGAPGEIGIKASIVKFETQLLQNEALLSKILKVVQEKTIPLGPPENQVVSPEMFAAKLKEHQLEEQNKHWDKMYTDWIKPIVMAGVLYLLFNLFPQIIQLLKGS